MLVPVPFRGTSSTHIKTVVNLLYCAVLFYLSEDEVREDEMVDTQPSLPEPSLPSTHSALRASNSSSQLPCYKINSSPVGK